MRACLVLLAAAWWLAAAAQAERPVDGRWRKFRTHRFDRGLDEEQRAMIERLEALGYESGSIDASTDRENVTRYLPARCQAGLNLYSSGHASEALLVDMQGHVLHRWSYDFWKAWPDYPIERSLPQTSFWRRVHLYESGDLLAIHEGLGILKLDRDSNLIWASPIRAHHDVDVAPNGDVYVLSREARVVARIDAKRPILEDFVSVLDAATGEERRRVSLLDALETSRWAELRARGDRKAGDIFHTNSLRVLDGSWAERLIPLNTYRKSRGSRGMANQLYDSFRNPC